MNHALTVIVSSYDGMSDLWRPFWQLFHLHWPTCTYRKILITNHKIFEDVTVESSQVGDDRGWRLNLLKSLDLVSTDYILYLQEDYLLQGPVDSVRLHALIAASERMAADLTHIFPRAMPSEVGAQSMSLSSEILPVPFGTLYRINLQAGIWRTSFLRETLQDDQNQWDYELHQSQLSRGRVYRDAKAKLRPETWALPYFVTGVVRGKWVPAAVKLCARFDVPVDLQARKVHWYWPIRQFGAKIKWIARYGRRYF